jgi:RND family efflux transporter MFP subunit
MMVLGAGCGRRAGPTEAASKAPAPEPLGVRVLAAETRSLARTLSATGSLAADETVTVSFEVAGRVAELRVDFGQRVRQGEVIAELDKREFALQLERSRAALAQALARIGLEPSQEEAAPQDTPAIRLARAQLEDARFKYDNAARLVKSGDVSQERYIELEKLYHARQAACDAARDELRTALASIRALRAEVKLADKRLHDATVRAPFDGSISARLVSPGQYLKDNAPIATLVKAYPLRLRVEVPETAAAEVRIGSTLSFTTGAAPGQRFRAVVRELNPALEARSRSLVAEARLVENDARLRPGMFVQVELALAQAADAVVVPRAALYQVAGLTKVFVIRNGRAAVQKIAPGAEVGEWVEAPGGGIRAGEPVAVSRLAALVDGAPVRVEAGR